MRRLVFAQDGVEPKPLVETGPAKVPHEVFAQESVEARPNFTTVPVNVSDEVRP